MKVLTVNDVIARLQLLKKDGYGDHVFVIRNDSQNPLISRALDADFEFKLLTQYGEKGTFREVVIAKTE